MPKFAANLTMLFNEVDFMDRFKAASDAGFKGVEYLFPYAYSKEQLVELLERNSLVQVLHNLPAGDWAKGERGIAVLPDRVGEFQDCVGKAIEYATALGCKQLNCLSGIAPADVAPDKLRETLKLYSPLVSSGSYLIVQGTYRDAVPLQPETAAGKIISLLLMAAQ